jgi:hypothetical protein
MNGVRVFDAPYLGWNLIIYRNDPENFRDYRWVIVEIKPAPFRDRIEVQSDETYEYMQHAIDAAMEWCDRYELEKIEAQKQEQRIAELAAQRVPQRPGA